MLSLQHSLPSSWSDSSPRLGDGAGRRPAACQFPFASSANHPALPSALSSRSQGTCSPHGHDRGHWQGKKGWSGASPSSSTAECTSGPAFPASPGLFWLAQIMSHHSFSHKHDAPLNYGLCTASLSLQSEPPEDHLSDFSAGFLSLSHLISRCAAFPLPPRFHQASSALIT